ncbi:septum formation inhibitor Maf, partial [Salmonella enterica]|nr:septum formation inhibitor Maf [Salmonella enterica]
TDIEFCDLLICATNSMRSPLCLLARYVKIFSAAL